MNYLDIFIVCLILLGSYRGFSKGLINELSSVFALILGVYGSLKFSDLTLTFVNINFAAQLESINDKSKVLYGINLAKQDINKICDEILSFYKTKKRKFFSNNKNSNGINGK